MKLEDCFYFFFDFTFNLVDLLSHHFELFLVSRTVPNQCAASGTFLVLQFVLFLLLLFHVVIQVAHHKRVLAVE